MVPIYKKSLKILTQKTRSVKIQSSLTHCNPFIAQFNLRNSTDYMKSFTPAQLSILSMHLVTVERNNFLITEKQTNKNQSSNIRRLMKDDQVVVRVVEIYLKEKLN